MEPISRLTAALKPLIRLGMHTHPLAKIDLSAILSNWQALGKLSAPGKAGAVVKANAYGHGARQVSQILAKAGCETFFTATTEEAIDVRKAVGSAPEILVFNGIPDQKADLAKTHRLTPIINTLHQLRGWRMQGLGETGPAVLHFDTGMNRLGLRPEDLPAVKEMLDGSSVGIVMSHLACADEPDTRLNAEQRTAFIELSAHWPEARKSLANSAGLALDGGAYAFDLSRPGIALFGGGVPMPAGGPQVVPALTLEAPILSVFMAPKGSSTGYGATRRFGRIHRLATVAIGYADGFPRAASNHGFAYIGGQRCKVVGRVSMDLTTLDVTDLTCPVAPGMMVEFIGANAQLEAQACEARTLGYELLTGLGPRVERIWNG
ncbi:MAG: alanine racemase [Pseudomonadota bacterium]